MIKVILQAEYIFDISKLKTDNTFIFVIDKGRVNDIILNNVYPEKKEKTKKEKKENNKEKKEEKRKEQGENKEELDPSPLALLILRSAQFRTSLTDGLPIVSELPSVQFRASPQGARGIFNFLWIATDLWPSQR